MKTDCDNAWGNSITIPQMIKKRMKFVSFSGTPSISLTQYQQQVYDPQCHQVVTYWFDGNFRVSLDYYRQYHWFMHSICLNGLSWKIFNIPVVVICLHTTKSFDNFHPPTYPSEYCVFSWLKINKKWVSLGIPKVSWYELEWLIINYPTQFDHLTIPMPMLCLKIYLCQ